MRVDYMHYKDDSIYANMYKLFEGIENGLIKFVQFPDGRKYDVSKVVRVADAKQSDEKSST